METYTRRELLRLFPMALMMVTGCAGPDSSTKGPAPPTRLRRRTSTASRTSIIPPPKPTLAKPTILPRKAWTSALPMTSRLDRMGCVTRMTVHHEGTNQPQVYSVVDVAERLRRTRACHMRSPSSGGMSAGDIGYHYIIDACGRIWDGRPMVYQGAHAGNSGLNRGNVGIVLLGNFDKSRPTPAQDKALKSMLEYLMKRYHVRSTGIYTHRELKPTRCPGTNGQLLANRVRAGFRTLRV